MTITAAGKPNSSCATGGKFLTFSLGKEEYGLGILSVREIVACPDITPVPQTPAFVSGVINLRGRVVAVLDLRRKLGMPPAPRTNQTCIIVVDVQADERRAPVGVLVDRVSEVVQIGDDQIEATPTFDSSIQTDLIMGIGKVGDGLKILLDIERVIAAEDVSALSLPAS